MNRLKNITWLFIFLLPLASLGQYGKDFNLMKNRVIVNHTESTVYAFVLPDKPGRHTDDEYVYYWFASNDIKRTRGAYEGKLLHGEYTEFYLNKNLKEKGRVKYGLKKGIWKSWYPNGEYKEIVHYKHSEQNHFTTFYENGNIKSKGRYKNNKLQGQVINYTPEGKSEKTKYRKGQILPKVQNVKKKKIKNSQDSTLVMDTATYKRRYFWQSKKKITKVKSQDNQLPLTPSDQSVPSERKKPRKEKKGKSIKDEIKIKKFLWIVPLQKEPPVKEKQL